MGDRKALQRLRAMADKGSAYALVNGAGENFGAWVIESMDETGTLFVREGVPRRVEFTINLARVDDALADPAGGTDGGDDWGDWWTGDDWDWWL
jgi:phage protein U